MNLSRKKSVAWRILDITRHMHGFFYRDCGCFSFDNEGDQPSLRAHRSFTERAWLDLGRKLCHTLEEVDVELLLRVLLPYHFQLQVLPSLRYVHAVQPHAWCACAWPVCHQPVTQSWAFPWEHDPTSFSFVVFAGNLGRDFPGTHRCEQEVNSSADVHFRIMMGVADDCDLNSEVKRFLELLLSRSRSVHSAVILILSHNFFWPEVRYCRGTKVEIPCL